MEGKIELEGIDVAGRRLFLKIITPMNRKLTHAGIKQNPSEKIKLVEKRLDPPRPESLLQMLHTMNQTRDNDIPRYDQLKHKVKSIKMAIQQAKKDAEKELEAAKAVQWSPFWMNCIQIILFILMILALFICWKFFPHVWSRSHQPTPTVWFATHNEELVCWNNEGSHK